MIVGAPKSGTTSLKTYLSQHPRVCTHAQREFIYFADDRSYARAYSDVFESYFAPSWEVHRRILAKSVAVMYSDCAPERLRSLNPDVLVVLVLRDPVDRAYSEYWYARRRGWESVHTFEEAVGEAMCGTRGEANQRTSYVARGEYARYIRRLLNHFSADRVRVFTLQALHDRPSDVCESLLLDLGIEDPIIDLATREKQNVRARARNEKLQRLMASPDHFAGVRAVLRSALPESARAGVKDLVQRMNETTFEPPPMAEDTRRMLSDHYYPHNRQLERLLGIDVLHWTGSDTR